MVARVSHKERNRRVTVQMRVFSCADAECRTTTPVSVLSGTNPPAPQQTQGTMLVTFRRSAAARACFPPHLLRGARAKLEADPLANIPGISMHQLLPFPRPFPEADPLASIRMHLAGSCPNEMSRPASAIDV